MNIEEALQRLELALNKIKEARKTVAGLGGIEALVREGIRNLEESENQFEAKRRRGMKGIFYKEVRGNELYVFYNGSLIYKRWLNRGKGKVFCNIWGNYPF